MKHRLFPIILLFVLPMLSFGQSFTILESDSQHISLRFELTDFSIDTVRCEGELMHTISTKGIVAPNDYGQPNLPTFNRFIAIPQGARAVVEVRTSRNEGMTGINIAPSFGSQCENDEQPPFHKNSKTYGTVGLYPSEPYRMAEPQQLRGIDVIHLGLCPVQFDPVRQEIAVHRQMDIDIRFEGGNGHFGDDRLRSPYWDPILKNTILNYDCLPPIDYDARKQEWSRTRPTGCEYLILTPNDDVFVEAAQELADYRTRQGILTRVMRMSETGAGTSNMLLTWFRNIYQSWDIPPVAVCLLGESGSDLTRFVPGVPTIHPKDGTVTSDNPYADVNNDNLPDINFTRIIAQNHEDLSILIGKQIEYEYTNPVSNLYYYTHPLTAAGWQNIRWFQITIATISGYLSQHGKMPVRINEIYGGDLGPGWSTAYGTNAVVSYFGPEGLGYIPATPEELGGWTGGTAAQVIQAINTGTYLIQHRDHGWNTKWYQPEIYTTDFNAINNVNKLTYLISVNCRTGMYDASQTCFVESLIRMRRNGHNAGIVGAIAPVGQTYSFANDIYLWGVWDLFDSEFLPDYGPFNDHTDSWLPSFANVAGKYFLETHVFPGTNEEMCVTTYNTFHTHGDPFLRIFTEMPQLINPTHDQTITCFRPFHITAPEGTQIALTANQNGQTRILATATGTGQEQTLTVMENITANTIHLTITGQNYLRHEENLWISAVDGPFVVVDSLALNGGDLVHYYGQTITADINLTNLGRETSNGGTATLTSNSDYLTITEGQAQFATLPPSESQFIENAFRFSLSDGIPDGSQVPFTITTPSGGTSFEQQFTLTVLSPDITAQLISLDDAAGNGNGYLDPGEYATLTFRLTNCGHYRAEQPKISLHNDEGYIRVVTSQQTLNDMEIGDTAEVSIEVYVEYLAGESTQVNLILRSTIGNLQIDQNFNCPIGFSVESFEQGIFNPSYWTNDPEHPWVIDERYYPYDGHYCAKSDTIDHSQTSTLTFIYNSVDDGSFSFFSTVSSEPNYDFLIFSIDGEELERWSGEEWWAEHAYDVSAGEHTYTWTYLKDHSVDGGLDGAWIDYIMLPIHLDATAEWPDLPMSIHPNPTTDQITLEMEQPDDFTVQIYDESGKLIMKAQNAKVISLKDQKSGLYHFVVEQNGQRWSRKIVKM